MFHWVVEIENQLVTSHSLSYRVWFLGCTTNKRVALKGSKLSTHYRLHNQLTWKILCISWGTMYLFMMAKLTNGSTVYTNPFSHINPLQCQRASSITELLMQVDIGYLTLNNRKHELENGSYCAAIDDQWTYQQTSWYPSDYPSDHWEQRDWILSRLHFAPLEQSTRDLNPSDQPYSISTGRCTWFPLH